MAFRTAVVIASCLIGLGGLARESFAQYYPPQAYPPARDYPLAGYPSRRPSGPSYPRAASDLQTRTLWTSTSE